MRLPGFTAERAISNSDIAGYLSQVIQSQGSADGVIPARPCCQNCEDDNLWCWKHCIWCNFPNSWD